ncbi:MAG: chromate transporter [Firmicutes bacterium HGW-Firmicutes-16]|nr:MAG: chromate transporter [Firmicutes bacterium HGW-Firmicutes-16]
MQSENKKPTCIGIFLQTLGIATFTLGGGYVMIPLLRERFVKKLGWIDENELTEMTAIGQSSPGAMIINVSVLVGYRLHGFWGAVCALLGTSLPAIVLLAAMCYFYDLIRGNRLVSAAFRGMNAGVAAVIADLVVSMAAPYIKKEQVLYALIMVGAFAAAFFLNINVAIIIVACGTVGVVIGAVRGRRKKV